MFLSLKEMIIQIDNLQLFGYSLSTKSSEFWPSMGEYDDNGNDIDNRKRPVFLSNQLSENERESILQFVGHNASLLACGACHLLKSVNGQWQVESKGYMCYIKDYDNRIASLTILDTNIYGPAKVVWTIPSKFEISKAHSNLLTFEKDDEIFGLQYALAEEADQLFEAMKKKKQKRPAPAPPVQPVEINIMSPTAGQFSTTELGVKIAVPIEIPKKEKKGLLGGFFSGKSKKEKKKKKLEKAAISGPTDFKHTDHIETLPNESRELFQTLVQKLHVQEGNVDQIEFLKQLVEDEMARSNTQKQRPVSEVFVDKPQLSARLSETRSSLKISKNTRDGNTPKDIKRAAQVKRNGSSLSHSPPRQNSDEELESAPTPSQSVTFDPLKPNWETDVVVPPAAQQPEGPPAPSRTASRKIFRRQDTPPNPMFTHSMLGAAPRLPPRTESFRRGVADPPPIPRHHATPSAPPPSVIPSAPPPSTIPSSPPISSISIIQKRSSPPPPPPISRSPSPPPIYISPSISKGIPAPPPPPPPDLMKSVIPPVAPPSSIPPPPPPPQSAKLAVTPQINAERRSFLDEIQNVDKSKLLRSVNSRAMSSDGDKSPAKFEDMTLLESIQKELDARRTYIAGSSDEDSSSEEDDDSWSD